MNAYEEARKALENVKAECSGDGISMALYAAVGRITMRYIDTILQALDDGLRLRAAPNAP